MAMECPTCGSSMVRRANRSNGTEFFGCSEFPRCRGTRQVDGDSTGRSGRRPRKRRIPSQVQPCVDRLPEALSPSRAVDFVQCPRKFYERSISRSVVFRATEATMCGTLTHHALERIFEVPRALRTPDRAVTFVRPHWGRIRDESENETLAALPDDRIEAMLAGSEVLVRKWFDIEDPRGIEPAGVEERVTATLGRAPMSGIIDRLDRTGGSSERPRYTIVDYKTGKLPKGPYVDETLFPIHVYAAAVATQSGATVDEVRLVYVDHGPDGVIARAIDEDTNRATTKRFEGIWRDIRASAESGSFECRTGPLCDWCDARPACPAWN